MDPADLIEENIDHIVYWYEVYVMSHVDVAVNEPEKLKAIQDFVEWCIDEGKESLDAPRGKDGTSFRQRREERREKNGTIGEQEQLNDAYF